MDWCSNHWLPEIYKIQSKGLSFKLQANFNKNFWSIRLTLAIEMEWKKITNPVFLIYFQCKEQKKVHCTILLRFVSFRQLPSFILFLLRLPVGNRNELNLIREKKNYSFRNKQTNKSTNISIFIYIFFIPEFNVPKMF